MKKKRTLRWIAALGLRYSWLLWFQGGHCCTGPVVNRHAFIEKGKTCGAKEFQPSQRSAGSLAGVHRHDPVTMD